MRDTHFYIDLLEAKIPIGGSEVKFPIEIYNDTLMNPNRSFKLKLLEVSGAAYAGLERQECVVIIENDDFPAEATAVFMETAIEVYENKEEIKIPFKIVGGDLKGDASITFAYDISEGTAAAEHFGFRDEGRVLLEKGDSVGFVILNIYNNNEKNDDRWVNIYMGEHEGLFIGDKEMSTCKLTIKDDDVVRTIGYSVARDTALEDSKSMEVSVVIAGTPKYDKPLITGELYFLGPDSLSANRGLKILGEPKFKVRGDTTLTYTIEIADNDKFESWGDSLGIRGVNLNYASLKDDKLYITIADNERRVHFDTVEYSVKENAHIGGQRLSIPIVLEGGVALEDTEIRLNIVDSDASESQYTLTKDVLTITAGSDRVSAEVRVNIDPTKLDTYFTLGVETEHPFTSIGTNSTCKVNILNIDANVQFSSEPEMILYADGSIETTVSVEGFNLPKGGVTVTFDVIDSEGTISDVSKQALLTIDDNKEDLKVKITNSVSLGTVSMQIIKVTSNENDSILDIIHPELNKTTINVVSEKIGLIDRADWTVARQASNSGENNECSQIYDGDEDSFWHTQWNGSGVKAGVDYPDVNHPVPPNHMVLDMKRDVFARHIEILTKQAYRTKYVEISLGDTKEGPWKVIKTFDNAAQSQNLKGDVSILAIGRYVRLSVTGTNSSDTDRVAVMHEFRIFGNGNIVNE